MIMDYDNELFFAKPRKTIRDVITVAMAIDMHKSSKMHKLKPRTPKRDHTKMAEAKQKSKAKRMSVSIKQSSCV